MAISSKGIKLSMATYTGGTLGTYTEIAGILNIPALGTAPNAIDVTCLSDGVKHTIPGIVDLDTLEFGLLFDNEAATSSYRVLKAQEGNKVSFQVELPDALSTGTGTHHGTQFTFDAIPYVGLSGAEVDARLEATLTCYLQSEISVGNPA